ncbi:hypothetical protein AB0P17_14705 [Streptomyces sp. NPDC088124]|uniref:hypothetical protein n=1 Tax=Streptomyces sp. NPDC088124 TaxID=3154654 RepID=UPI003430A5E5
MGQVECGRLGDQRGTCDAKLGLILCTKYSTGRSIVGTLFRTPLPRLFFKSPERAANQLTWFATSRPEVDWEPGSYYEKNRIRLVKKAPEAAELWERSRTLLGLDRGL